MNPVDKIKMTMAYESHMRVGNPGTGMSFEQFKQMHEGKFPSLVSTGIKCECGFSDMQFLKYDKQEYSIYKCPKCHAKHHTEPGYYKL